MSRRNRPEKRPVPGDARYNNQDIQSFINRVMRSGSYTVPEVRLRCSFRDYNYPDYTSPSVGFRIVWEQ